MHQEAHGVLEESAMSAYVCCHGACRGRPVRHNRPSAAPLICGVKAMGDFFIEPARVMARLGRPGAALILDVRRRKAFEADPQVLPTALRRDHREVADWADEIPALTPVVVYCVHGEQVSQSVAAVLRRRGIRARVLDGGIEAWRVAGGPLIRSDDLPARDVQGASRWVLPLVPSAPVLGRAWVLRRFLEPCAEFYFVASGQVQAAAVELGASPLVERNGPGDRTHLANLLAQLADSIAPLKRFAEILAALESSPDGGPPEARGFQALMDGSRELPGDATLRLERGFGLCDALYAWLRGQAPANGDRT